MKKSVVRKINKYLIIFLLIFVLIISLYFIFRNNIIKNNKKEEKNVVLKSKKNVKKGEFPVIKLNGLEEEKIVKNGVYEELGAVANDKEDGDITDKIKIKSNIKIDTPGTYEVKYSVFDKDKNKVEVKRKIIVFEVNEKNDSGIPVLMYHYFYDDTANEKENNSNYMAKSLFEQQLNYLSTNDYYFPSMKELNLYLDGKLDLPSKSIIITLDDGENSNYTIAYPLAVKYKVPIVMFVVTSWTDVSAPLQKEMKNTGYIRFHSHTDNMHEGGCGEQHGAKILCVNHEEGVNDLKLSKEKLGNADALAYPCGDTNLSAMSIVSEAGYSLAFTTSYGKVKKGDNKLSLPRVRMNDGISLERFIESIR